MHLVRQVETVDYNKVGISEGVAESEIQVLLHLCSYRSGNVRNSEKNQVAVS